MKRNLSIYVLGLFAALIFASVSEAQTYDQCVWSLNSTAQNALSITGAVTVNATSCGVVVNSSSSSAFRFTGSGSIHAKYIDVVGGYQPTGSVTASPAPHTGATPRTAPLSFLMPPVPASTCDYTDVRLTGSGSSTLTPGTYCNGISITGSRTVSFQPGVYILMGGGLQVTGSASLTGSRVTFFLTQGQGVSYGPLSVSGSPVLNLTAPTSGPYYGILFYQDPSIGTGKPGSALVGSPTSSIDGVFYFPTTGLSFTGSPVQGNYLVLIADTIAMTGSATLTSNFPGGRSPLIPPITIGVTPPTATLSPSQTKQFTANIANAVNPGVNWALNPIGLGTVSSTGLYTAPATITAAQTVSITATSVEDPTKSASALITLTPPVVVTVAPLTATLYQSQTRQFTATVLNTSNTAVTWTASGAGSISASGIYSAPATINGTQTVIITATSQADPTKSATATVTLSPPVSVSVAPATTSLFAGQTQQYNATVTNTSNAGVNWTASAGTISATGIYTAPPLVANPQTVTITATSQFDSTKSGTATVTLVPASVSVTPPTVTLIGGATQQFNGIVTNATNTNVTWTFNPSVGTLSATGLYSAPALIASQQNVSVTATSVADPTKSNSAVVTLAPVTIQTAPTTKTLFVGQTQQFTISVGNTSNTAVTWMISPPNAGSITPSGLYTAPSSIASQEQVTVTATSQADTSKTATATLTLVPVTITVLPATSTLLVRQTQQFSATVGNADNTSVVWSILPATAGSISTSGLYTAPPHVASPQSVTVTAASAADSSKTATATVMLLPVQVTVAPTNPTVAGGATQQFTASITNAPGTAVTWSVVGTGTISPTGLYTAPAVVATQLTDTVTATSQDDSSASASTTVTLQVTTISVTPQTATLKSSETKQFTSSNPAVNWTIAPTGVGTISTSGLYTAPASIDPQQTAVTVTATSQTSGTVSGSASVTLLPVTVTVAPPMQTLDGGQTQQFTTTVGNTANTAVTWTVAGGGTISTGGLYTAPATAASQLNVIITATSQADTTKSGTASVTVVPATVSAVTPTSTTLLVGQTQQFSASVAGATNTGIVWSVMPPSGAGSISSTGLYTAPASIASLQTVTIIAASAADPAKTASASVILQPVVITISPTALTLTAAATQQFAATVTNAPNTNVTWSVSSSSLGSVNATGLLSAAACVIGQQTITVIATSVADPTRSASATVTLLSGSGFSFIRPIRMNHLKVPNTDQANFPILITGVFPYLATVANGGKVQNANGYDLIFTADIAGSTKLDHEIESYDPATGTLTAWVRIPVLSHTSDTVIYLAYGNANITTSQQNHTGVWDTNFKGVWHLNANGAALSAADSVASAHNGTVNGATPTPGQIGGAGNFSGSGQFVDIGNLGTTPVSGTISLWVNAPTRASFPTPFTTGALNNYCGAMQIELQVDGSLIGDIGDTQPGPDCRFNNNSAVFTSNFLPLAWHHLTITYDQNARIQLYYYDGVLAGGVNPAGAYPNSFEDVRFGAGADSGRFWNGQIDEVRLSSSVRSADWIAAEFANQSSPSTFFTVYAENSVSIGVSPGTSVLYASQTQPFSSVVMASCSASGVTWTVEPSGIGTVDTTGLYTAPSSVSALRTASVRATSTVDTTKSGTATVTLFPALSIGIAPTNVTLYDGQSLQFTASVSNAANTQVAWSVYPYGAITANGLYTAPSTISSIQTVTVGATSVADPTKTATTTITLSPGQGTAISQSPIAHALSLIADALCRKPHAAPAVDPGPDQFNISLVCTGANCSAPATLSGAAANFTLLPGQSLTYLWTLNTGPAPVQIASPSSAMTTVTFTTPGTYTFQLAINDGISTSAAVTHVTINPAGTNLHGSLLVTPTASGPNAVNSSITLQAKFVGNDGNGGFFNVPNTSVTLNVTGANATSITAVTDANGSASFTYFGRNAGSDNASATTTVCCDTTYNSNVVPVTWTIANPQLSGSPVTGRFFTADGTGVFNTPAAQQPVFSQTFSNINFNPVAKLTRPFTDVVTDPSGAVIGPIVAQGNNFQAGAGPLYAFSAVFTGSLNVPSAGPVTFTFVSKDSFIFGVGNGATAGSGPQTNTPSTTPFQNYPVMGGVNQRSSPTPVNITVNFPAAGTYAYEVDYAKGSDNQLTLQMLSGTTPIPASALLSLTPTTVPSTTSGGVQSFIVNATDPNGVALPNQPLTINIIGPNQQTRTITTDGTGQVSFAYAGTPQLTGIDQVQATLLFNGATSVSNTVVAPWNSGTNTAPLVSAGSNQSVTLPAKAILNGSVTDDGLPLPGNLTITWSMVSGPGTVTFDDPAQAATAASFSLAGTYVLQLSATDGALTTNSTVSITVSGVAQIPSGWITTPLDQSTVSGQVPITLITGITLTSGTLSYFPAGNPSAAVTLSPNTTGTGQIGTLDPTLLRNGSYFILL